MQLGCNWGATGVQSSLGLRGRQGDRQREAPAVSDGLPAPQGCKRPPTSRTATWEGAIWVQFGCNSCALLAPSLHPPCTLLAPSLHPPCTLLAPSLPLFVPRQVVVLRGMGTSCCGRAGRLFQNPLGWCAVRCAGLSSRAVGRGLIRLGTGMGCGPVPGPPHTRSLALLGASCATRGCFGLCRAALGCSKLL